MKRAALRCKYRYSGQDMFSCATGMTTEVVTTKPLFPAQGYFAGSSSTASTQPPAGRFRVREASDAMCRRSAKSSSAFEIERTNTAFPNGKPSDLERLIGALPLLCFAGVSCTANARGMIWKRWSVCLFSQSSQFSQQTAVSGTVLSVNFCRIWPLRSIMYNSMSPSSLEEKMIRCPSGDQTGLN